MRDPVTEPGDNPAELNTLRDECGALETALATATDAARIAELQRELAECRQRVFEAEQQQPREFDPEAEPAAVGSIRESVQIDGGSIEAADVDQAGPNYAGMYSVERAEADELRHELAAEQERHAGGGMERERVDPDITRLAELAEAHRTGVQAFGGIYGEGGHHMQAEAPRLAELAAQHDARLLEHEESFTGEVVQQIEAGQDVAYVIEADGERVMVPQIEGAELDVGDDVQVSRDQQGNYEAEAGYDYGM